MVSQRVSHEIPQLIHCCRDSILSPTEDILVYAETDHISVRDRQTGRHLRQIKVPEITTDDWSGQALISHISGLAFSPDGQNIAYLSQGSIDLGDSPHLIIVVNITTGMGLFYELPGDLCGAAIYDQCASLDYAPNGRFIVFDGTTELGKVDIFALNISTGQCFQITDNGKSFGCVWKGH